MQNLFKDDSRSLTVVQHPSQQFEFADQNIYGCGPLSIPIIDPRLVLEY